ncbi:MAG: pilus assembly protein [Gammaproteobacteria bacterium]
MERQIKSPSVKLRRACVLLLSAFSSHAIALTTLNVSDTPVEVAAGVEPNIMILSDDSGSMDWEVMTRDTSKGGRFTGTQPDGSSPDGSGAVKHRDSNDDGVADCAFADTYQGGYIYGVEFGSNTYPDDARDCYTADDEEWRFRNHDFNPLYFDPRRDYKPWAGVDADGVPFGDIDINNAPNNPYNPTEHIDLERHNSNWGGGTTRYTSDRDKDGAPDGFRFYTWQDKDNDTLFDDGEETGYRIAAVTDTDAAQWGKTAAQVKQNFANWFSYYRSREFVAKAALSHVIRDNTTARIGYATINNNNGARIRVASMNISPADGAKRALLDKLYTTRSEGGTPLRTNLDKVGRYFECASGDIFGSSGSSTPGSTSCPVQAAPAGTCQGNHTVLMTDGFYGDTFSGIGNADSGTGPWDGGAFADGHSNTLADIAMHYYEKDLHSLANQVPPTNRDISQYPGTGTLDENSKLHQHMSTNTVGFGVNGVLTGMPADPKAAANPAWPDPAQTDAAKIDDLRHAAYNGRGQFLSANDPVQLADALSDIFRDIGVGRSAASAVAFNTQNIESDSLVFRAFFDTKTNTGNLIAQRVNADGTIDAAEVWSAAEQLDAKVSSNSDTRVIITSKDNAIGGLPFDWGSLTSTQKNRLNNPVPDAPTYGKPVGDERLAYLRGHDVNEGPNFHAGEFRERLATKGKLGDIVHSSPAFVGQPPFFGRLGGAWPGDYENSPADLYSQFKTDNTDRTEVVYVGANDGMLHAFKAATGEELFAYVPSMVYSDPKDPSKPYLSELTKPNYSHRFYVDLPPGVNDVFMTKTGASSPSWNSVLIGGLSAGGKGYFALNITNPSTFNTETNAKANVMWEFAPAHDTTSGKSDLGYSFSQPLIAMSNVDSGTGTSKKWVAIFGNGYNSTSADGRAKLYILFIEQGQDGWQAGDFVKIDTGVGGGSQIGTTQNGIGGVRAIDTDGNGTVDRVYAGDLNGNLYRFNLSSSSTGDWTSTKIFQATYGTTPQPITTRPIVVKHPTKDGYIVITATGRYFTNEDATSTAIQSMYGIWDDGSNAVTWSQLVEQVLKNEAGTEDGFTVRTLTNNSVNWKNTGTNRVKGWYIDFDVLKAGGTTVEFPGERAVRNLQLRGGLLFVNTVLPRSNNSCTAGPGGFELGFDPVTGGSGTKTIFDLNGDGKFDANDNVGNIEGAAKIIVGLRLDGVPTDAAFIGNFRVTQVSGDDSGSGGSSVHVIGTNTLEGVETGRQSWREVGF